ncbi:hypothetical protein QL285_046149 [Trifolium repens]|jgi:hypothetical protein|nr:hypothetical protein QL285_046149 [Trifolium repens]
MSISAECSDLQIPFYNSVISSTKPEPSDSFLSHRWKFKPLIQLASYHLIALANFPSKLAYHPNLQTSLTLILKRKLKPNYNCMLSVRPDYYIGLRWIGMVGGEFRRIMNSIADESNSVLKDSVVIRY